MWVATSARVLVLPTRSILRPKRIPKRTASRLANAMRKSLMSTCCAVSSVAIVRRHVPRAQSRWKISINWPPTIRKIWCTIKSNCWKPKGQAYRWLEYGMGGACATGRRATCATGDESLRRLVQPVPPPLDWATARLETSVLLTNEEQDEDSERSRPEMDNCHDSGADLFLCAGNCQYRFRAGRDYL